MIGKQLTKDTTDQKKLFLGESILGKAFINFQLVGKATWLVYQRQGAYLELVELGKPSFSDAYCLKVHLGGEQFNSNKNSPVKGQDVQRTVTYWFENDKVESVSGTDNVVEITLK